MKWLKNYWSGKSVRQRIYLCIVMALLLTFLFFVVKGNIFDKLVPTSQQASVSQSSDNGEDSAETVEEIHFHISWIDIGILVVVFGAYGIHKYREKKKGKRL